MSSLLTNTSAMVALQTLKSINKNLGMTQAEISTGKKIATAKDNAAIWGITATMQTDVSGFKAISESLSLGNATLTVARDAAETITGLLDQLKGRIVAAQEENVDRTKIQADVVALRDQIATVVEGSQFNGLNLVKGYDEVRILASMNRSASGDVTTTSIGFFRRDLTTTAGVFGATASAIVNGNFSAADASNDGTAATATFTVTAAPTGEGVGRIRIGGVDVVASIAVGTAGEAAASFATAINANEELRKLGITAASTAATVTVTSTNSFGSIAIGNAITTAAGMTVGATSTGLLAARAEAVNFVAAQVSKGDSYRLSLGAVDYEYVAGEGDSMTDVVNGLERAINSDVTAQRLGITAKANFSGASPVLLVDNGSGSAIAVATLGTADGVQAGGLRGLESLDVTTQAGARAALAAVEGFIQTSIAAAAAFGSAQGRMQTQSEFVSKVMDGFTSGIGALVDADMEAASAKLQALQVQQQLGIQALSIANQSPQSILALFR